MSIRRINASVLFPCMKNEEDDHELEGKAKEKCRRRALVGEKIAHATCDFVNVACNGNCVLFLA